MESLDAGELQPAQVPSVAKKRVGFVPGQVLTWYRQYFPAAAMDEITGLTVPTDSIPLLAP